MQRRGFIKKAALATAGAFAAPYILPSGRLFAASGNRIANHVVLCLFAGGVRNFESMQKAEGNLMPFTLTGNESINPQIAAGMDPLPTPSGQRLQQQGTLFREFRFGQGPTGHFSGHSTALTGQYNLADINLKQRPFTPTLFEYYRKHNSPSVTALNAWWVANALGPYPALNFSQYPGYGAEYGANFIQPASIISIPGYNSLGAPKDFSTAELEKVKSLRSFMDDNFSRNFTPGDAGVTNTEEESAQLEAFIKQSFDDAVAGQYDNPWGTGYMSGDMFNVFFAEQIIKQFKPELTVVNMQDIDVCHANFTEYCNNIRKADYSLAHLWQTIQSTPGMANDTILIAVPEHGRNENPNTIVDAYGKYALDHTGDEVSRQIFCLVVGPPDKVVQNQVISTVTGESIDTVPTIAKILGFYNDIPGGMLQGTPLDQAFV
ncbi:MAG: hypothetical protein POELPBGB_01767 [Bacteroidia bacterium]|nr:hypothetical protein [Bacteroidia bacterium]